jgi:hypothetical protein
VTDARTNTIDAFAELAPLVLLLAGAEVNPP